MATTHLGIFPRPKEVDCPQCGSSIRLYISKDSEFCVCDFCHSFLQFGLGQAKKIRNISPNQFKRAIPLGAEGILMDIPFKVVGYMERKEKDSDYSWVEYVLYNDAKGYAMLSECQGHWNFILGKNFIPELEKSKDYSNSVRSMGGNYRLYHKYFPVTTAASGEFDWNILAENINTYEFISPPYILIKESKIGAKKKDREYYKGQYMEPEVIAKAFSADLNGFLPKSGIISNQPSAAFNDLMWSFRFTLAMTLALLFIALLTNQIKPVQTLYEDTFGLTYEPTKGPFEFKPIMTSSFELKNVSAFLEVNIRSEVQNNWLETTIVLVNDATNQTWEVTKGVERYSGVEDGESWEEGNPEAEVLLSEIPKGKYHFNLYPASGDPLRDILSIRVSANGILWRNVGVCVAILFLIPLINYFRMIIFEKKRWSLSDYSPYEN